MSMYEHLRALAESGCLVLVVPHEQSIAWVALPASACTASAVSASDGVRAAYVCGALWQMRDLIDA